MLHRFIVVSYLTEGETTIVPERRVTLNINDKLQFLNESNTTISPDKLKIKVIQGIFKEKIALTLYLIP
jgi:hypothetical protein